MSAGKSRDLAIEYLTRMANNDFDGALQLTTPDAVFWLSGPGDMSREQVRAFFAPVGEMIERMKFPSKVAPLKANAWPWRRVARENSRTVASTVTATIFCSSSGTERSPTSGNTRIRLPRKRHFLRNDSLVQRAW